MSPAGTRLRAHGLGHAYPGGGPLFRGLSFELAQGEVVAVCGPSGSGKSTLLAILADRVRPTEGHVERHGVRRVGRVFQNPYGVPGRTALDHVVFPLLAAGHRRRDAEPVAVRAMARFDLERVRDRRFRELSGGEAQRLMLARAACAAPDLLLVDEPTAQLDLATAATVNATLRNIGQAGTIVVVATHDARTRAACGRVIDLTTHARPGPARPQPLGRSTGAQTPHAAGLDPL
jgi:lipoprotein-releasing system ATP-binding protein